VPPNVYIIAGPNGAGKTTFARKFLPKYRHSPVFVNADLIAQGLSPFSPQAAAVRAGRIVSKEIARLAERKADFAFETTLSGRGYLKVIRELRQRNYRNSHFLSLYSRYGNRAFTNP
jgi:predicted ABC-type ATPase